jgi:predicted GNAT family N-acyltransferase
MTDQGEVVVTYAIEDQQLAQLLHLFSTAWWMADRTEAETTRILQESDIVVAVTHRSSQQLLGFARVLTDYTHIALVLDVVVDQEHRGAGYGAVLMDAITHHPDLKDVRSLELVCQPELRAFYRRWGFTDKVGQSLLMRRTSDPLLAP